MGRTNLILLGMGILACVVLSLLMHRGLKIQKAAKTDPVVKAVTEVFGSRLQLPPRLRIKSEGDRRVAVLQLVPELPSTSPRLTRDVGRFVWQQANNRFDDLVILLKEDVEDRGTPIPIPRPFLAGRGSRPRKKPTPRPASRPAAGRAAGRASKPPPRPDR